MQILYKYFESTYIGDLRKDDRTRKNPLFPSHMWSVYSRIESGISRTNNKVETWNKQFSQDIRGHPGVNSLIQSLVGEQGRTEFLLQNLLKHPVEQAKCWKERDAAIIRVVSTYAPAKDILSYLDDVVAALL